MMFRALALSLLTYSGLCEAQVESVGCFTRGECLNSPYVALTTTETAQGCLDFCQVFEPICTVKAINYA